MQTFSTFSYVLRFRVQELMIRKNARVLTKNTRNCDYLQFFRLFGKSVLKRFQPRLTRSKPVTTAFAKITTFCALQRPFFRVQCSCNLRKLYPRIFGLKLVVSWFYAFFSFPNYTFKQIMESKEFWKVLIEDYNYSSYIYIYILNYYIDINLYFTI